MMISIRFTEEAFLTTVDGALRSAIGHWLDLDGRILDGNKKVIGHAISVYDDPRTNEYIVTAEVSDPDAIAGLSIGIGPGIKAEVLKDGGTVIPGDE